MELCYMEHLVIRNYFQIPILVICYYLSLGYKEHSVIWNSFDWSQGDPYSEVPLYMYLHLTKQKYRYVHVYNASLWL